MPGGPLFPRSVVFPINGKSFPNIHEGATNSKSEEGIGVIASLDADARVELRFSMPPVIPAGVGKLRCRALANAVVGDAKFLVQWKSVAIGETADVSDVNLNSEGLSTLTWGAGDNDDYKQLEINLDADVLTLNEELVLEVIFESATWTLAQLSTWTFSVIWE